MKYVSIDIETTGLCPFYCQVLEFGAVIEDTEAEQEIEKLPFFQAKIVHDTIQGEWFALNMNKDLIDEIRKVALSKAPPGATLPSGFYRPDELGIKFAEWIQSQGLNSKRIIAAGKNFAAFDLQFLKNLPSFMQYVGFHHRSIDPSVYFLRPEDNEPPSSNTVLERAGLRSDVKHRAVEDARNVIEMFRNRPTWS